MTHFASDDETWRQVHADAPIDDAAARQIAAWWQQAPHGHAGVFTAIAAGRDVPELEVIAAIDSEYDEADDAHRAGLDNLRTWAAS